MTELADAAVSHFLAAVEIPRTSMTMEEWFAKKRSFKPHKGQQQVIDAINTKGVHEIDVIAGKRGVKSRLVMEIALYYIAGLSKRVWVLGPTWDIVDRIFQPLWELSEKESEVIVQRDSTSRLLRTGGGGLLEGVSWRTPEQIEGRGVHVVITDESQHLTQSITEKIRARLVGDWIWLRIGSPAESGSSYYEEMAETSAMAQMPSHRLVRWATWENPDSEVQATIQIAREDLDYLKNAVGIVHPAYVQRKRWYDGVYGGESVPPSDLVFTSFNKDTHISPCPFDKDLPVYLAIDPGHYPGYYAVCAFQPHPWGEKLGIVNEKTKTKQELWQIDEIYVQRWLTEEVINECKKRPWYDNVIKAVIDVAARRSDIQTGQSEIGVWQQKTGFPVYADWVSLGDGINTHRRWLLGNRIFHDREKCMNTIREYGLYKMRAKQAGDSREIPFDRHNHAMKAIAYFLVSQYGTSEPSQAPVSWTRSVPRPDRRIA